MNRPASMTPIKHALVATSDGVMIRVRAQPGARRNGVFGVREDEIVVDVTAPPEKGLANHAIAKLLAKTLGIARGRVNLVAGPTNRHKRFCVQDEGLETVQAALAAALAPSE